ncbi:unnamed protein product [Citrullus colocynthis]|uniref:Uncharacterized protein n=1 Tax=Citrullus colocynthis TaxID=252529 RepID=A0ABP0XVT2_9ROSI
MASGVVETPTVDASTDYTIPHGLSFRGKQALGFMDEVVKLSFWARRVEEVESGSGVIVMVLVSSPFFSPPKRHDRRGKRNQKNRIREKLKEERRYWSEMEEEEEEGGTTDGGLDKVGK